MFKERKSVSPTIKSRKGGVGVYISRTALNKMAIYTDEVNEEVGWLGTAYRSGNAFHIKDVFLFDQQVHGATTEISAEGLAQFAEEVLKGDDGMEILNNLKVWGHSHVRMGLSPSGQDNKQMEEFAESGYNFFIRLICNKLGELAIDIYDYEAGIEYHNVPWVEGVEQGSAHDTLNAQIQDLKNQLDALQKQEVESLSVNIKEEIKVKVKKFGYARPAYVKPVNQQTTWAYAGQQFDNTAEFDYTDYQYYATQAGNMAELRQTLLEEGITYLNSAEILKMWGEVSKIQKGLGM